MIKAIIFDAGGVYLKGHFKDFLDRACAVLKRPLFPYDKRQELLFHDLHRGAMSSEKFLSELFGISEVAKEFPEILKLWTSTWVLDPSMKRFVAKLKGKYQLALLSNSDPLNCVGFNAKGWYGVFEVAILSHETGMLKPEKKIFELVLKRLERKPDECVFIDDHERHVLAAREVGMHAVQYNNNHETLEDLKKKLRQVGVDV